MTQHAAAGPSSASMWMNCPASITKARGMTRPSSTYAREGTAAHEIARRLIEGDMFPPEKLVVEGEEFIIGRNMLLTLRGYVNAAEALRRVAGDTFRLEQRVVVPSQGLVYGTADCFGFDEQIDMLTVMDLKYGMGIAVSPDTPQTKIYAIGAMEHLRISPDAVNLVIFQPRLNPEPQQLVMAGADLEDWNEDVLAPAVQRVNMLDETEKAGPWCRFCVRKNECAAFARHKGGIAADAFDDGLDLVL